MTRPNLHEAIEAKTRASIEAGDAERAETSRGLGLLDGLAKLAYDVEANPHIALSLDPVQRQALATYQARQLNQARRTNRYRDTEQDEAGQ